MNRNIRIWKKSSKRSPKKKFIFLVSVELILLIFFSYLSFNFKTSKYNDNIVTTTIVKSQNFNRNIIREFNKDEKIEAENLFESIISFVESKYKVHFTDKVILEKKENLKLAYTDFEDINTLGEFDVDSGYILISNGLQKDNKEKRIGTLVHELIHFLSQNGPKCGLVNRSKFQDEKIIRGVGLTEGITEKITEDYLRINYASILNNSYMNNLYYINGFVKIVNILEFVYKENLYQYYFVNDTDSMSKEFNHKVHKNTISYFDMDPYKYLEYGMDNLLIEAKFDLPTKEKRIRLIKLALYELLEFSIDKKDHEKFHELIS